MNQLIGFLLLALTLCLALLMLGSFSLLFNLPALLLIVGCLFGVIFLSYGTHAFAIFKYANLQVASQKEYFWVISFFDNLINTSMIAGLIGSLIGMINIVSTGSDEASLRAAVSFCLVSTAYGFIFAKLIFEPLKQNVLRRAQVANINANVQRQIEQNNKLCQHVTMLGGANIIACFVVLVWSF